MNKAEYDLLQNKVKESGQTQQAVVLHAIADLKIASAEEVEELKKLSQMLAEILSQLRGGVMSTHMFYKPVFPHISHSVTLHKPCTIRELVIVFYFMNNYLIHLQPGLCCTGSSFLFP